MKRMIIRTAALCLAAAAGMTSSCRARYEAKEESDIRRFLSDNGVYVSGSPEIKTVTIPAEFGEVYSGYNELQKSQGFDLTAYKSREANVYTYRTAAEDNGELSDCIYEEVHIMVCENEIIAADISSPRLDGEMRPVL